MLEDHFPYSIFKKLAPNVVTLIPQHFCSDTFYKKNDTILCRVLSISSPEGTLDKLRLN